MSSDDITLSGIAYIMMYVMCIGLAAATFLAIMGAHNWKQHMVALIVVGLIMYALK